MTEDIMTEEYFDEQNAPYSDPDTFIGIWNAMTAERRQNNIGLFRTALGRVPTDQEIKQGIIDGVEK